MSLYPRFPSVRRPFSRELSPSPLRSERLLLSVAVAAVLAHAQSASGATFDWTPTLTGPFNWDNAGGQNNWSIAGFPNSAADVANLTNNLAESQFIDLNQAITLGVLNIGDLDGLNTFTIQAGVAGSLNFNNGPAAAEINQVGSSAGDTVFANISTVGALNIVNMSANSLVLSGGLASSAASGTQAVTVTAANVRLAGDISDGIAGGKIALVQNGTGTMSLLGNNSFTGGVTLNSGSLNIGNATALGATASTLTINAGTTLTNSGGIPITLINNNAQVWAGDFAFDGADLDMGIGAVTLTDNRQVSVNSGNFIVGGIVSDGAGSFGLTKVGGGTLTLAGVNAFDGPITVSGGRLAIRTASALGTNPQVTVTAGGTLMLENGVTVSGKTLAIAGEGPGQAGALRSVGDNVWSGDITADTSSIVRVVSTLGVLTLNGNVTTAGLHANGFVLHGDGVMNGVISGEGSLTRSNNDAGTWTFNSANTYTGTTLISNGAIRLGNANAIQNSAVTLNSAAVDGLQFAAGIGTFNLVSLAGGAASNFTLNDAAGQPVNLSIGSANTNTIYPGIIGGTGSITKVGSGTLTLSNASTYSGGVVINSGIVSASDSLAHLSALENVRNGLGTGIVTLTSGSTLQLRANGLTDATPQLLVFGNAVTLTGNATISVDRQGGTGGTSKVLALGSVSIGDLTLTVINDNNFVLRLDSINLTGNATLDPSAAVTNVIVANVSESGGARSLTKVGAGRLTITGNASHTGGTSVNAGTLQIGDGGYAGTIAGNITDDATVIFNRADAFTYPGQISGVGALVKSGSGTLVLTGGNTYSGTTGINNGTLLLDFATSASVLNSLSSVVLGGTLYMKGNNTGTTSQVLGSLSTIASLPGRIVLDNNGGAGTTLTLGDSWAFGGSNTLHIDVSRGGTLASNPVVTNGVITATLNGVARATITRPDGRTYFATVDTGIVAPQTALTPLAPNSNSTTTNFEVSGDLVTTSTVNTGTLRIDTTLTAGSLDISGGNLTFGRTAFLMDGSHDFEIKRTSGSGTIANTVIHQYGTGSLTYSAPIAAGGGFTKGGPGLLIGNMDSGAPGSITLTEGVYRVAKETAKPTGNVTLSGGTLELGSGDFLGGIGTGAGQVRVIADGGFSAFGAPRVVNLGGANAPIIWDQTNFLPNNATLYLSSAHSNATIEFQNPLVLGSITRTVRIFDGSAEVDAQFSRTLVGSGELRKTGPGTLALNAANLFSGVVSVREGKLAVNGQLTGSVNVVAGTLQGSGDGATTGLINGNVTVGDGIGANDSILAPGNSIGTLTTTGALSLASDAQFKFEFESLLAVADQMAANGITIDPNANFQALNLAGVSTQLALNTTFIALNNTSLSPITGAFSNLPNGATFTVGLNTFQANYFGGNGNDLALVAVVPEPASAISFLAGCAALIGLRRSRPSPASA